LILGGSLLVTDLSWSSTETSWDDRATSGRIPWKLSCLGSTTRTFV